MLVIDIQARITKAAFAITERAVVVHLLQINIIHKAVRLTLRLGLSSKHVRRESDQIQGINLVTGFDISKLIVTGILGRTIALQVFISIRCKIFPCGSRITPRCIIIIIGIVSCHCKLSNLYGTIGITTDTTITAVRA